MPVTAGNLLRSASCSMRLTTSTCRSPTCPPVLAAQSRRTMTGCVNASGLHQSPSPTPEVEAHTVFMPWEHTPALSTLPFSPRCPAPLNCIRCSAPACRTTASSRWSRAFVQMRKSDHSPIPFTPESPCRWTTPSTPASRFIGSGRQFDKKTPPIMPFSAGSRAVVQKLGLDIVPGQINAVLSVDGCIRLNCPACRWSW